MKAVNVVVLSLTLFLGQSLAAPPEWFSSNLAFFRDNDLSALPPSKDVFYRFGAIDTLHNGDVIAKRSVKSQVYIKSNSMADAVQVQYRTTTADDQPDATLTTIFVPTSPTYPPQILAVQMFSDSAAVDCASSWSMILGSKSMADTFVSLQTLIVQQALKQGYYVSAADFQGSKAAFYSRAEGRAVLDGVRALLSDKQLLPDSADSQIVLTGYSGGAHATASAVQQAFKYAPELNIVGASFGGTPIEPRATLKKLNGGENSYFALAGLVGLMNAYPELDTFVTQHLYANGSEAVAAMRHSCYIDSYTKNKNIDIFSYTSLGQDLLNAAIPNKYLSQEVIGKDDQGQQVTNTAFPMHIYHAVKDSMIPFEPVVDYVNTQCEHGAHIQFVTDKMPSHSGELIISMPENFEWIKACLNGEYSMTDHCTRRDSFL